MSFFTPPVVFHHPCQCQISYGLMLLYISSCEMILLASVSWANLCCKLLALFWGLLACSIFSMLNASCIRLGSQVLASKNFRSDHFFLEKNVSKTSAKAERTLTQLSTCSCRGILPTQMLQYELRH